MAVLTIGQIVAVSYPAVLAEKRKAANQWAESAFLRELERQGGIDRVDLGPTIEAPLDYQRNPATVIQSTELQPIALAKTEVITSASYTPAEVVVPVTWSNRDEALNPTQTQKVALVKQLLENAIESHDDILEQDIFATTTNGFLGFKTFIPASLHSSCGGIDSTSFAFWAPQGNTYVDDSDIESGMTTTWNQCAKGSGAKLIPTLIVSDAPTQSLFEGTQQPFQRYIDTDELKAGFKILGFKQARYVFSQYAGNSGAQYFLNTKNFKLVVSKQYFRDRSETVVLPNATGYTCRVYSACQVVTNNRSRLGINGTASSV